MTDEVMGSVQSSREQAILIAKQLIEKLLHGEKMGHSYAKPGACQARISIA